MLKLEWLILVSISLAFLFMLMSVFFLIIFSRVSRKGTLLKEAKPQKKRRLKQWRRECHYYRDEKQKLKRNMLVCLIVSIGMSGIVGYSRFYQLTNLTEGDTENIVSGFYLVDQVEKQLELITEGEGSGENIHTLAVRMASFYSKKGSDRGSESGQLLVNKYYAKIGQLGVNLSSETYQELLAKELTLTIYKEDIQSLKKSQKKVLDFYKISESSLSGKK